MPSGSRRTVGFPRDFVPYPDRYHRDSVGEAICTPKHFLSLPGRRMDILGVGLCRGIHAAY